MGFSSLDDGEQTRSMLLDCFFKGFILTVYNLEKKRGVVIPTSISPITRQIQYSSLHKDWELFEGCDI